MNDEEKLFMNNPLKAIWIKLGELEIKLNRIVEELEEGEEQFNDDLDLGNPGKDEGLYGN